MNRHLLPPDPGTLVAAVEEQFGISIPDEVAPKICTMGQLYDFVLARVARGQTQVCVTSAAFYRLRRALGAVGHVPRKCVRPRARLEDLVPIHDRPLSWQHLRDRLGELYLPPLERPAWMDRRIEAASFVPLFLGLIGALFLPRVLADEPAARLLAVLAGLACLVGGVVGGFAVYRLACRWTEPYAVHFPRTCTSVRDLVYMLICRHPAPPLVSDTTRPSDKEIWGALCAIVGDELGVPPYRITRDSQFDSSFD